MDLGLSALGVSQALMWHKAATSPLYHRRRGDVNQIRDSSRANAFGQLARGNAPEHGSYSLLTAPQPRSGCKNDVFLLVRCP